MRSGVPSDFRSIVSTTYYASIIRPVTGSVSMHAHTDGGSIDTYANYINGQRIMF